MRHVNGMKISADGQRSYSKHSPYCPDFYLSPQHTFGCLALQVRLFKINLEDPDDLIFSDKAVEVAEAIFDSFGAI